MQPAAKIATLAALDDRQLLQRVQSLFGRQYGEFTACSQRQRYNMNELIADQLTDANAVLIGNAAHSLHPIAGQGLNLGLRDVIKLSANIQQNGQNEQALSRYAKQQQGDIEAVRLFVNTLIKLFAINRPGCRLGSCRRLKVTRCQPRFARIALLLTRWHHGITFPTDI